MSSKHFSLSSMSLILLVALVVALLVSPTISTSSPDTPLDHSNTKIGFQVTLKHIDSNTNFTRHELFQRALERGRKRLERLHSITLAGSDVNIQAPIHEGSGEFLMDLSIGTPPLSFSAILDTGSDLTWTQCQPCQNCFIQPTPIFDPKNSSSYSDDVTCSTQICKQLSNCTNTSDGKCEYEYLYGDFSSTRGVLATETFTFEENNVSVAKIGFGCGHDNEGFDDDEDCAGIVGLGRGDLSLVSQLDEPKFSYCLTSFGSDKSSILSMGSKATTPEGIKTTPLIKNPIIPTFYYISLQGITIGETFLAVELPINNEDGSGGLIIDSGTMLTYLEESVFNQVKNEFSRQIKLPPTIGDGDLEACFIVPLDSNKINFPNKFTFHFQGGADLELLPENYFIIINGDGDGDGDGVKNKGCLTIGNSRPSSSYGPSIFGIIRQQNTLVVYDLAQETLSFLPTNCDQP